MLLQIFFLGVFSFAVLFLFVFLLFFIEVFFDDFFEVLLGASERYFVVVG